MEKHKGENNVPGAQSTQVAKVIKQQKPAVPKVRRSFKNLPVHVRQTFIEMFCSPLS